MSYVDSEWGDVDKSLRASTSARGVVSGYVWKLIRESTGVTQIQLAEFLGADVTTVQGWESGRRPLSAVKTGDIARFRINLTRRGVHPRLFAALNDALDADIVIDHAMRTGSDPGSPDHHPLAAIVHRRDLTNLITWPFNGIMPAQLRDLVPHRVNRRGPAPSRPNITSDERTRFFEHLIGVADQHRDSREALLRRQAIYLLSFDTSGSTHDWLLDEYRRVVRRPDRFDAPAAWFAVRSAAIALTRHGDRDPLLSFVATALHEHDHELANLNYWAYWLSEVREAHVDDSFMRQGALTRWDGSTLLSHLINRVGHDADQLELNVRTLWQLLLARPHLLTERPELRTLLAARVSETLDCDDIGKEVRQELSDVAYAARLSGR